MNLFTLIEKGEIHPAPDTKVVPAEEFSRLIEASEIVTKTKEEEAAFRRGVVEECETLKEEAEKAGFDAGMARWSEQIALLEAEITKVRKEMENAIVPLALTAVKKLIGRELEAKPGTIGDIVATALKTVSHHRKIAIYVNQLDLENVEAEKPRFKTLFEHLDSLAISARSDVQPGGCIIETEAGIINAQLENQFEALEAAFRNFFETHKRG